MKETSCFKLTAALLVGLFVCGCRTGPTDEQLIETTMNKWKQAMVAQDIDAIMSHYSEEYSSLEAQNKEQMRELMEMIIKEGFLENISLNLDIANLTVAGDTAEFFIIGEDGDKEMEFTLKKEGRKTWRIIGDPSDNCSYESYAGPYGDDCLQHEGYYRCWDIHVPEGLSGSVPLVIDLHGFTGNPSKQRALSGFGSLADSEGFIVVWPHGLCDSWNSGGECCGQSVRDDIDDVGFIRKLVEQVSGQYDIDQNRVYVTGLSNGCAMAQRLADEASDMVAAVACMSLHLLVPEDTGYTPISVMTIVGTDDHDIYDPGDTPGALANFDTWKTMNNCTGSYTETWRSGESYAWTYKNCDKGTEVSLVTVDEGGHILYKGEGTDIDTTRLAWDFMKRFTREEKTS